MSLTRAILSVLFVVAAFEEWRSARAEPCRKTLLQWSYGTSFGGGADLSEPLVADRPDFTESSSTVGYGVAQLETGYTYTYESNSDGSFREQTFPESLLRVGVLAEWFEFRIAWSWAEVRETEFGVGSNSASGAEDLYLGTKLALTPQEDVLPETAVILQMTVPSGSSELTAGEVLPGINFIYAWDINDNLATAGQTQFNRAMDDATGEPYLEYSQSWTVARALADRVGSYAEWFMFVPDGADTVHNEHYFNGGFTYNFSNDLMWDVRAGVGLNDASDDYFVGTGLSVRWY